MRRHWATGVWILLCSSWFLTIGPAAAASTWVKLADPPKDLAGRESPPGLDGAWVYVPEWKGFLLQGGCSPTYSNEGWFFDPDRKAWTLLWPNDALVRDGGQWRVLLPRDLVWSLDRPGPARGQGAIWDTQRKQVVLFGGHPSFARPDYPDPRLTRDSWLGPAKLGTWTLDPAGKFRHVGDGGPVGVTRGVCDPVNQLLIAMPVKKAVLADKEPGITWVCSLAKGAWEARTSPAAPRALLHSGFVYDSRVKKCVYFNGHGETWTYDAGKDEWTNMNPTTAPPPRRHAAMCFDEARGVTILHAGVHHPSLSGPVAFSIHKSHNGIHHADTWCYDAARNTWTELKPAESPPRTPSGHDLVAYDSDRRMVVMYDVAVGVWALKFDSDAAPAVKAALPASLPGPLPKPRPRPAADPAVVAWQNKLRSLPANTWVDLGIPVPNQGCMNIAFDPAKHCLVMLGGCGGAMFPTPDDQSYNNQIWLLDMEVGKYSLRRAHQVWGPDSQDFRLTRIAPGCTRGNCFDSVRKVLWTAGGNGWSGVGSTHIKSYDVALDRFSLSGPPAPWNDGECGMFVHDPKHDVLVYLDGRRHGKTYIYDPKKRTWTDGGPAPLAIDETLAMFSHKVYDPELGIIAIVPGWKNWQVGQPRPQSQKLEELAIRTFAYDVTKKQWRDLAPKNQDKVPFGGMPGIAYDSRNRAILVVKSDHGDVQPLDPTVPYGSLWVLDLASNTWQEAAAGPRAKLGMASMAYDPRLNVTICRFSRQGLWAYRYKGGCPADAFRAE